jgi:hypothetical protein
MTSLVAGLGPSLDRLPGRAETDVPTGRARPSLHSRRRWHPPRWAKGVILRRTLVLVRALLREAIWLRNPATINVITHDGRALLLLINVREFVDLAQEKPHSEGETRKGLLETLAKMIEDHEKTRATLRGSIRTVHSGPIGRSPRSHFCHRIDTTRPYAWLPMDRRAIPGSY